MRMCVNRSVSLHTRNRAPEWRWVAPSESDFSPYLVFYLDALWIGPGNRWQNFMTLDLFVSEIWALNYLSVGQLLYVPIHKASRIGVYIFSPFFCMTAESSYTNVVLDIFAINLDIFRQNTIVVIYILGEICGFSVDKSTNICVFEYHGKRAPEWRWMLLSISFKNSIVSQTISYNGYISHILGYQVVKFDCIGVLVSRGIGLQPYPSRPVLVHTFCLSDVT